MDRFATLRHVFAPTLALVAWLGSCTPNEPQRESTQAESLPASDPRSWVKIYDPDKAFRGYTLTLQYRRLPVVIDMNGRQVHSWPGARVRSRVRLLPNGSLLGLARERAVVEYDWEGDLVWRFDVAPDLPHHDIIRLRNGNTMFPILPKDKRTDEILEVDPDGTVVWRWDAGEHLAPFIEEKEWSRGDVTHINSVQELPQNTWFDRGDERFRPGNILISARNLSEIFVVDKRTNEVVWSYGHELDLQHEALMLPPGYPGSGNIQLFDNGFRNTYRYRKSRVIEIDPSDKSVVWEYLSEDFYSPSSSLEQPLPNGNVLISSSRGNRIFEVDRDGTIVWQWTPPFDPVRPSRYAYDFSPQLEALGAPREVEVRPSPGYRHIDRWVYQFAPGGGLRKERLEREENVVLADNDDCRRLLVPDNAELRVSYGISRPKLTEAGLDSYQARFRMTLEPLEGGRRKGLFEDGVTLTDDTRWREQTISLVEHARQWIRLCVETEALNRPADEETERFAFWSNPSITTAVTVPAANTPADEALTDEEAEVQREHLRALGYLD